MHACKCNLTGVTKAFYKAVYFDHLDFFSDNILKAKLHEKINTKLELIYFPVCGIGNIKCPTFELLLPLLCDYL